MHIGAQCHGMKANPTGYLLSKYEYILISSFQDLDLRKTITCDGNRNRELFELCAVKLKMKALELPQHFSWHYNLMEIFPDAQAQLTPQTVVRSGWKF